MDFNSVAKVDWHAEAEFIHIVKKSQSMRMVQICDKGAMLFAEDLFIGWLGEKKWSWRVVAGQNVAYDQFPCQYQLYYRGKAKNSLWYDPVFQVRMWLGNRVHT